MSSLSNKFSTRVFPEERAASKRHRLESDFEPGRVTVPSREVMGVTVSWLVDSSMAKDLAGRGRRGRGREDKLRKLCVPGIRVRSHVGLVSKDFIVV